jgi:molybdopterin-guanine dinucleotide biosynthesis protein A
VTGPIAGVLLTGGTSRRMGVDKTMIRVGSETLATRAARVLSEVCDPVLEVGPGRTGLPSVADEPRGRGPLVALATAVGVLGVERPILLLAVDLPLVDAALLELVAGWPAAGSAVPMQAGFPQSCCARYGTGALALLAGNTSGSSSGSPSGADPGVEPPLRSLRALLERSGYAPIPEAEWQRVTRADALDDVDTPEDLARLGLGFSL